MEPKKINQIPVLGGMKIVKKKLRIDVKKKKFVKKIIIIQPWKCIRQTRIIPKSTFFKFQDTHGLKKKLAKMKKSNIIILIGDYTIFDLVKIIQIPENIELFEIKPFFSKCKII